MNEKVVKVLLIEDDPGDVRLTGEWLAEATGAVFELEHADRLATGLEALGRGQIDAILLDLSLPDSQGLDTFIRTYATAPCVPILLLTSPEDELLAGQAVRQGAQDCLIKGQADGRLLTRAIRYAVERKQAERDAAERALRASEERFRRLAESAHDMIFIVNREGSLEYVNDFGASRFGRPAKDIVGHPPETLFPPETVGLQREDLQQVGDTLKPLFTEDKITFPHGDVRLTSSLVPLNIVH